MSLFLQLEDTISKFTQGGARQSETGCRAKSCQESEASLRNTPFF